MPERGVHNGSILIAGPTAVGKSAVALALAELVGGEIISVDSMQVYRGLDIGTAKPSDEEQRRVRHHLIDVAELHGGFDAARFVQLAAEAEREIARRGRVPIYCGGTGLYFKALLNGLEPAAGADPELRAELEALPSAALLDRLKAVDPAAYERIDRANPRRVIRALEIIALTGQPLSAQRKAWSAEATAAPDSANRLCVGLARPREALVRRIEERVDAMFAAGLVEETRQLMARGLAENRTAMQAIGYRQVVEFINGERSLPDTIALVKQKTRQFAKRQMTWFRHQMDLQWIELGDDPSTTATQIADMHRSLSSQS